MIQPYITSIQTLINKKLINSDTLENLFKRFKKVKYRILN